MDSYTPSAVFSEAAAYLSSSTSLPGVSNAVKLELYGLFKLLTVAHAPNTSKPSIFDMAGRAKWDAWAKASKDYSGRLSDAESRYIAIAQSLGWREGSAAEQIDEDKDDRREEGDNGGLGVSVSKFAVPGGEEEDSSELHRLAVDDDAFALCNLIDGTTGFDVNQRDQYGYTALHLAADRGNLASVKALLAKGADVTLKDLDEMSAVELAKCAGHDEVIAVLETSRS